MAAETERERDRPDQASARMVVSTGQVIRAGAVRCVAYVEVQVECCTSSALR